VQLWQVDLDAPLRAHTATCLDAEEVQRAGGIHPERDRHRFIGGRVWLKHLLARSAGVRIDEVRLASGTHGKPHMLLPDPELTFNTSRSGRRGLIAIARSSPVGIDIEAWRPIPDASLLVEEHFDADERLAWAQTPVADRDRAFLRLWVRKEACRKAWGFGWGHDLACIPAGLVTAERRIDPLDAGVHGSLQVANLGLQDDAGYEAALSLGASSVPVACSGQSPRTAARLG
jgi:phosphopantetheinyl transferase